MNVVPAAVTAVVVAVSAVVTTSAPETAAQTTRVDVAVDCDVQLAGAPTESPLLESFEAQNPERIVDTRPGEGGDGPVPAGCSLVVDMSTIAPDDATAVALSVTAITPAPGFVTAYACNDGLPGTSSLNPRVGVPTPNLVVVAPDADGEVCLYVDAGGELIVDVSGWWGSGRDRFRPIAPVRVEDTRESLSSKLPGGGVLDIQIAGVAVPADAEAVSINVAATQPEEEGFLLAYPCGIEPPLASNVNFLAGETRSVAAIVKLGESGEATGRLCVFASTNLHVVVDVTGYSSDIGGQRPDLALDLVTDTRIVDTRRPDLPGRRFGAGTVQRFDVSSVVDDPGDVTGVLLNAVAVAAASEAFVTIYPCTDEVPFVASINHDRAATANVVVSALDDDARFCVYAERGVDVVIDLVGVYRGRDDLLLNQLTIRDLAGQVRPLDQQVSADDVDYTFVCDGPEVLDLRLGRAPGASVSVNGGSVLERPEASPDVRVVVPPNGLLAIVVTRDADVQRFAIRCLPADFVRFDVESPPGSAEVPAGWYVTEVGTNDPESGQFIAIVDRRGVPVWFKRVSERLIDVKALDDGRLVATPISDIGMSLDDERGYVVIELTGSVVEQRLTGLAGFPSDHHDHVELPAGGVDRRAVVSYPQLDGQDLSGLELPTAASAQFFGCDPSVIAPDRLIVAGAIVEVGGDAAPWQWTMTVDGGFDPADSPYAQCFGNYDVNDGAGEVDPFHINSIDRVLDPGCEPLCDYVVSARHLDTVFRIDRATGQVEWEIGPTSPPGAIDLTVVGDPHGGPLRPHDARMVDDVVTMHDNRTGTSDPSRAVAYQIDVDAGTATMLWEIDHPDGQNNPSLGSARITDDGNVLIGWGRARPLISEHDADGVLLASWAPRKSSMPAYRIVKYPLDAFDADQLRASAGGIVVVP